MWISVRPVQSAGALEGHRAHRTDSHPSIRHPMTSDDEPSASRVSRRTLMLGVALLAVIAAVLVITLSGGGSHSKKSARNGPGGAQSAAQAASSYLGIGVNTVRRRLRSGETLEQIANSTPGHSARALEREILAARATELSNRGATHAQTTAAVRKLRARLRAELRRQRRSGALLRSAANYLGISEAALREQLRSGKTLAQVGEAHGHTRTQLIEGIVRGRTEALETARQRGEITRAQEKSAIRLLQARVARTVDAKNL